MQIQSLYYHELIPFKSVKGGLSSTYGNDTIHYVALDITSDIQTNTDKHYIFCAIYDNSKILMVEKKAAYSHIHNSFNAFWNDRGYEVVKESLENVLSMRNYQLSTHLDDKTGKLMAKIETNPVSSTHEFQFVYSEKDVKEMLQWIDNRAHSDDIQ
ncbi:MAG: hypothetical protein RBT45_06200 [Acholeplasmataceae bacterium]|jgi:hypothetical protein|nr:hypothetical protein [Acholeplasmataceae bacterium]